MSGSSLRSDYPLSFTCSAHFCLGLVQGFSGFPHISYKMQVDGLETSLERKLELEMISRLTVSGCMRPYDNPIQGVFPSHAQCFQDRFRIHQDPEQLLKMSE